MNPARQAILDRVALKKTGKAEDIAKTAAFLIRGRRLYYRPDYRRGWRSHPVFLSAFKAALKKSRELAVNKPLPGVLIDPPFIFRF